MKYQYESNEPLRLSFPAFFDRVNKVHVTDGLDTVQYVVKAPDLSSFVVNPTFNNTVKVWTGSVAIGSFQEGLWLVKATSNAADTFAQYRAVVWGDYVDDIGEARQAALGRWKIVGTQLIIYEDDGTTPFRTFDLLDKFGQPSLSEIFERAPA